MTLTMIVMNIHNNSGSYHIEMLAFQKALGHHASEFAQLSPHQKMLLTVFYKNFQVLFHVTEYEVQRPSRRRKTFRNVILRCFLGLSLLLHRLVKKF